MKAFILAGGFATRLWPLTEKRAKPLLPLAGVPLVEHLVRGIPEDIPVTISTNAAFKEAFTEWAEAMERDNIEILIEDTKSDDHKLGALGATAQWISDTKVDDDVLLLTGDNYCGFAFSDFLAAAKPNTSLIAVHDIGELEKAKAFGTVIADGTSVHAFEEKPKEPKSTLVNTGCSLLPKNVLPILIEFAKDHPDNVGGIFEELLQKNESIECFRFSEPWFDIGSFSAYLEATQELIGTDVHSGSGATLHRTECEGSVVLGNNTKVSSSTMENVVTFEDCTIENCVLRNCILDRGCILKNVDLEGKMLREDTRLVRE